MKFLPFPIKDDKLILLLDTNILLMIVELKLNIHQMIEMNILEDYYLVCPMMVREELNHLKKTNSLAKKALNLVEKITYLFDESNLITRKSLVNSVDKKIIDLAKNIPRSIVVTQDTQLRTKLLNNKIPVLQFGMKRVKFYPV